MTKNILLICISCFFFASCNESATTSEVLETSDGYKYEVISKGDGAKALVDNYAYFNAEVVSLEGEVVYSSAESSQPSVMKLTQGVDGSNAGPFAEILLAGSVGDSIHIYLGREAAQGSGFDSLIYKVGFFDMQDEEGYQAKLTAEKAERAKLAEAIKGMEKEIAEKVAEYYSQIKSGSLNDEIITTDSGLKYILHEKGTGELPEAGKTVSVNYYGVLSRTGEEFDNSWKRGVPFQFGLGNERVIKGWDEGVALLPKGSKASLIIPSELGYGESGSGSIKPGDELIFYIEVNK